MTQRGILLIPKLRQFCGALVTGTSPICKPRNREGLESKLLHSNTRNKGRRAFHSGEKRSTCAPPGGGSKEDSRAAEGRECSSRKLGPSLLVHGIHTRTEVSEQTERLSSWDVGHRVVVARTSVAAIGACSSRPSHVTYLCKKPTVASLLQRFHGSFLNGCPFVSLIVYSSVWPKCYHKRSLQRRTEKTNSLITAFFLFSPLISMKFWISVDEESRMIVSRSIDDGGGESTIYAAVSQQLRF